jgi:hypothetical protein
MRTLNTHPQVHAKHLRDELAMAQINPQTAIQTL